LLGSAQWGHTFCSACIACTGVTDSGVVGVVVGDSGAIGGAAAVSNQETKKLLFKSAKHANKVKAIF
jgi:hypothetical protein